jgi:peptidoglycan hydrolase CwlO-like protein
MYAELTWPSHRTWHRSKERSIVTITECIIAALLSFMVAILGSLLAARKASRDLRLERDRLAADENGKRNALLASVHKEAADSGRELYQQLCNEQQARITQQHTDIQALAQDVGLLRGQLTTAQAEMAATRHELIQTQEELRKTRTELQQTRDLLASTKAELVASREAQAALLIETDKLRARVLEL